MKLAKQILSYVFAVLLFAFAIFSSPFGLHNILFFVGALLLLPIANNVLAAKLKGYKPFLKWIALIAIIFWALVSLALCSSASSDGITEAGSFDTTEEILDLNVDEEKEETAASDEITSSTSAQNSSVTSSVSSESSSSTTSVAQSSNTTSTATSSKQSSAISTTSSQTSSKAENSVSSTQSSSATSSAEKSESQTSQAPAESSSPSSSSSGSSSGNNAQYNGQTVFITKSGERYHYVASCPNSNSVSEITLEEAIRKGKTPCKKCVLQ